MTPHNEAKKGDIARTVIMPGDPLRAKYIAEKFLENYRLVNDVRNMFAYTGYYKGTRVTVMASGMGFPSIGIYSYELFKFYDVDNIIRVGSCGAYDAGLRIYDLILVDNSYSDSNFALLQSDYETHNIMGSKFLNEIIKSKAEDLNCHLNVGTVYSSEVFYSENPKFSYERLNQEYGCLAVEMESFALFNNAQILGKNAACILTVSDSLVTKQETTSDERERSFDEMIRLSLESVVEIESRGENAD